MNKKDKKDFDINGFIEKIKKTDYKKLLKDQEVQKKIIYAVTIIFLIFFMRGCLAKFHKEPIQPRPVKTEIVIKKDAPIYIGSFGTLKSINDVNIQAQITGKMLSVNFKEGDEVSKGDLLFVIDPSEYQATLLKAEASLAESIANAKLAKDTLERNRTLVEKELISEQDFETYQTDLASAVAKVDLDRAQVELARINLGYCYIVSPIDGMTGKRLVDPGNIITANTGPVLVNVKTINDFYIDFTITEKELPRIRDAMEKGVLTVEINPIGDNKGPYEGKLIFIDNKVDESTGTVSFRAIVSNKERKLWAGQFVTLHLILSIEKNATLAPYEAISIGQNGPYLFVVDKNRADLRILDLGERQDEYIIVNKGVKPGEKVVTLGQLGLVSGVSVKEIIEEKKKNK